MPSAQFTRFAEKLYHKSWPALKRAARRFRWCGRPTPAGPCRRRLKRSPPLRSSRLRTPRTTSRHRLHTGGSVRSRLLMALIFGLVCRRGKSRTISLAARKASRGAGAHHCPRHTLPSYCLVPVQQAKAMAEANSGAQAPSMQAAAAPAAAPAVPNMATTPAVPSSTATVVAGAPAPQAMIPARVPQPGVQIAPATWAQTAATTARLYPAGMQPAVGYGAAAAPLVAAGALKRPQPPVVAPADAGRNVRRRVNPPMKQEAAPTIGMPTT